MPIKGTVKAGGKTFTYGEKSFGKNRGLSIAIDGVADARVDYEIKPNPHNEDSKWYNKNQAAFYKEAAGAVAKKCASDKLPNSVKIDVNGHDYTLSPR